MFNGHFYEEGGEEVCRAFLQSGVVAIVIDPPFGGLVEVLARQVRHLWGLAGKGVCVCVCVCVCVYVHVCCLMYIHRGVYSVSISILHGATRIFFPALSEDV